MFRKKCDHAEAQLQKWMKKDKVQQKILLICALLKLNDRYVNMTTERIYRRLSYALFGKP